MSLQTRFHLRVNKALAANAAFQERFQLTQTREAVGHNSYLPTMDCLFRRKRKSGGKIFGGRDVLLSGFSSDGIHLRISYVTLKAHTDDGEMTAIDMFKHLCPTIARDNAAHVYRQSLHSQGKPSIDATQDFLWESRRSRTGGGVIRTQDSGHETAGTLIDEDDEDLLGQDQSSADFDFGSIPWAQDIVQDLRTAYLNAKSKESSGRVAS